MITSATTILSDLTGQDERQKKRGDRHNETIRTLAGYLRDESEHIERTLQQLVDILAESRAVGA